MERVLRLIFVHNNVGNDENLVDKLNNVAKAIDD